MYKKLTLFIFKRQGYMYIERERERSKDICVGVCIYPTFLKDVVIIQHYNAGT